MKFWNFELFTSLPSLHLLLCFPSDAVDAERRGRRPRAAPSSRPQPFHVPGSSRSISAPPRGAISLRARRGSTPSRHDEAVTTRPAAPRLLPSPFPPLWPVQQTCSTPSPLLSLSPEPSRDFFSLRQGARRRVHGAATHGLHAEPLLRSSSPPTVFPASFVASHWSSQARSPPPPSHR